MIITLFLYFIQDIYLFHETRAPTASQIRGKMVITAHTKLSKTKLKTTSISFQKKKFGLRSAYKVSKAETKPFRES